MDGKANALLKDQIAAWLAVTRDVEVRVGLDAKEARVRAQVLLDSIRSGSAKPEETPVDEELKQVLSVVVALLADSADPGEARLKLADAVYKFIRGLEWPFDVLGERNELLKESAILGWAALGMDAGTVTQHRQRLLYAQDPAVLALADHFLHEVSSEGQEPPVEGTIERERLFAACFLLRARADDEPTRVLQRAAGFYRRLSPLEDRVGLLDESDYFLGLAALWAGTTARVLGRFDQAESWLVAAEQRLQRLVNSDHQLTKLAYARAALLVQTSRNAEALALLPDIKSRFDDLGMPQDSARAKFMMALSLNGLGRWREAQKILEDLDSSVTADADDVLRVNVDVYLGSCLLRSGERERAEKLCLAALKSLKRGEHPFLAPLLKWGIGDAYASLGEHLLALGIYRSALADHITLDMQSLAAQIRLTIAATALELGRDSEAESEILAALPTIEEQRMVPEGLAAVALLKESVRQRKTDPNALRELREHLQAANQK